MRGDRNEEICQNQPFCTFQTFALPDRQTDRATDQRTHFKDQLCKWIELDYIDTDAHKYARKQTFTDGQKAGQTDR